MPQNSVDPALQILVGAVSQMSKGAKLGITLIVSGTVISGNIVSPKEFGALTEGKIRRDSSLSEMSAAELGQAMSSLSQPQSQDEEDEPNYMHLTDIQLFTGVGMAKFHEGYYRFSLAAVEGWCLGLASIGDAPSTAP